MRFPTFRSFLDKVMHNGPTNATHADAPAATSTRAPATALSACTPTITLPSLESPVKYMEVFPGILERFPDLANPHQFPEGTTSSSSSLLILSLARSTPLQTTSSPHLSGQHSAPRDGTSAHWVSSAHGPAHTSRLDAAPLFRTQAADTSSSQTIAVRPRASGMPAHISMSLTAATKSAKALPVSHQISSPSPLSVKRKRDGEQMSFAAACTDFLLSEIWRIKELMPVLVRSTRLHKDTVSWLELVVLRGPCCTEIGGEVLRTFNEVVTMAAHVLYKMREGTDALYEDDTNHAERNRRLIAACCYLQGVIMLNKEHETVLGHDRATARAVLEKAVRLGDSRAVAPLGRLEEEQGHSKKARRTYLQGANANVVPCMVRVSELHHKGGLGLPKDPALRVEWLSRAAAHSSPEGNDDALFHFARLLDDESLTEKHFAQDKYRPGEFQLRDEYRRACFQAALRRGSLMACMFAQATLDARPVKRVRAARSSNKSA